VLYRLPDVFEWPGDRTDNIFTPLLHENGGASDLRFCSRGFDYQSDRRCVTKLRQVSNTVFVSRQ